jgi:hypothetical protein
VPQDTCLDKKFSIVFYVVLDSSYSVTFATTQTLQAVIDTLNDRFKNICVTFENCSTVFIPMYTKKGWFKNSTESEVKAIWYTPNTINFYLPDTTYNPAYDPQGYTYEPPLTPNLPSVKEDLMVVGKKILIDSRFLLAVRMMGRFFGLRYTYEEIAPVPAAVPPPPPGVLSHEFAIQSFPNCRDHGDGLCDTEADPDNQGTIDGMGNYYVPPKDNIMSGYFSTWYRLSNMQYYRMVYVIMTKRMYLY